MTSLAGPGSAAIVPITLTLNDRTGLTLWAPPWEDDDGEQWQGFLGDGNKILVYASTTELAAFIASGEENDLSDHPAWGQVLKLRPDQLRPGSEDHYDLDQVYDWAGGEPDPVHVSALANVMDMVGKIAECCDDGALRRLVQDTPEYAELVDEDVSYQGREGRKAWNDLGDTIADSWERALKRVAGWLSWQGDFDNSEFEADDSLWERIGAEPITLQFPDATLLTVRGEVATDPDSDETEIVFLGTEGGIAGFNQVRDLAYYCRTATDHKLEKLEFWSELRDEDDEVFTPHADARFDLRKPSPDGAAVLTELVEFAGLDVDTEPLAEADIDRTDWTDIVDAVREAVVIEDAPAEESTEDVDEAAEDDSDEDDSDKDATDSSDADDDTHDADDDTSDDAAGDSDHEPQGKRRGLFGRRR